MVERWMVTDPGADDLYRKMPPPLPLLLLLPEMVDSVMVSGAFTL